MKVLSLWKGWIEIDPRSRTMRDIAISVGEKHGIDLATLRSGDLRRSITAVRHEAMYEMYQTGRYSNQKIANFFNLVDHTTTVHARRVHQDRLAAQAFLPAG